ncbi:MAG TPA: site-2 protease family protein [Candidatus Polarisedimenticolaceae bacterium]|nr:site-2 protease family protein [Candidatus Polarisedimenticolaceae bacterium]
MDPEQLRLLPLWYVVFLLSVTFHEAGHAFAAYRGGDRTAYLGGQVSLNPWPHMLREPFGTILVPLLSYVYVGWMMGWASAPYDPYWEQRHPRRAAWMAAAGPAANLLLAAVGFALLRFGLAQGLWTRALVDHGLDRLVVPLAGGSGLEALAPFASILLGLNVALFVFNLLPVPPMDGASVLAGLFAPARRARDMLRAHPLGGLVGLLVAWYLFPGVFRWVFTPVRAWLYS